MATTAKLLLQEVALLAHSVPWVVLDSGPLPRRPPALSSLPGTVPTQCEPCLIQYYSLLLLQKLTINVAIYATQNYSLTVQEHGSLTGLKPRPEQGCVRLEL